jgi:hypothetical protein
MAVRTAMTLAATTACAAAPPRTASTTAAAAPDAAHAESSILGLRSREGCFHVSRETDARYRFWIEDVTYPDQRSLGSGHVAIYVAAGGLVDLVPRPVERPRDPRLEFTAEGEVSGPFELTLLLVDSDGRESQPTWMNRICPATHGRR